MAEEKKGPTKGVRATAEEAEIIEKVQVFYGVKDFSAMTLLLYKERWEAIEKKIEEGQKA